MLAAFFALAVIQDRLGATSKTLHVQGIGDVFSAELAPAHAGAGSTAIDLNMNNERDKDVTAKVLNWLLAATIVGNAVGQSVSNGGTPTEFTIKFTSGDAIGIIDAVGTLEPTKVENGIQFYKGYVEDQVTVYWKGQALRIVAPELKTWIEDGWLQEQLFTFTPEEAIAAVLKQHPEFPATGEKQI